MNNQINYMGMKKVYTIRLEIKRVKGKMCALYDTQQYANSSTLDVDKQSLIHFEEIHAKTINSKRETMEKHLEQ